MINKNDIYLYLYSMFFTFKYLANDTCEFSNLTKYERRTTSNVHVGQPIFVD